MTVGSRGSDAQRDEPGGSSADADCERSWWRSISVALRAHLGIDARALAAFRIGLGGVLLLNLGLRARSLEAFYTDAGVFPRSAMADIYPAAETVSLHGQFGSIEAQAILFGLAGLAAVALLVGYRTSAATIVSLVLLFSLHGRNPLVLNGGDILLRQLLLWAIFLPLGERWSVDARRRSRNARDRIASIGTAGLMFQVVAVYAINAVLKHRGTLWAEGTAIRYVYGLDQFTVFLGDFLAGFPGLLTVLGRTWLVLLTVSWLLLVLRGWPRTLLATAFVGAHVAMGLTMQLGVFPVVSIVGLLVFYPAPVWDALDRRVTRPVETWWTARESTVSRLSLPSLPPVPRADTIQSTWRGYVVPTAAAFLFVVLLVSNLGSVTHEDFGPLAATDLTADDPNWSMFAPDPLRIANWYVVAGRLESGNRVDAVHGGNVTVDRPPDLADTYASARWRKYMHHVGDHSRGALLRRTFAADVCRDWNRRHDTSLETVTITRFAERVVLDGDNPRHRTRYGPLECARM